MFDPFKPADPSIPGVAAQAAGAKKPAPAAAPAPAPPKEGPDSVAAAETVKPAARAYARPATRSTPVELPKESRPVAAPQQTAAPEDHSRQMIAIAVCLIACALVAGMAIAWKLHQMSQASIAAASATAGPVAAAAGDVPDIPGSNQSKIAANGPVAPGVVATAAELEKPWASKAFTYRDPVNGEEIPALVVHLPRGGYWGISMIEPFGSCQLEYVTNLDRLRTVYDFQADHPMVGDPCNHAVFDLMQYGDISTAEVRGAIVHGMGVRPPLAIEIEQHGSQILAVKME